MAWLVYPQGFFGPQNDNDVHRVEQSLRFNSASSAYLSRTFVTPSEQGVFTFSAWVKRGTLGTAQTIFSVSTNHHLTFTATNALTVTIAGTVALTTNALFRDPTAWYHILYRHSGSSHALYVNGEWVGTGSASSTVFNSASGVHAIGRLSTSQYFDGYLAEINFIDGLALFPSSFGELVSSTNRWRPKAYTGTYGNNGFYLPFKDNGATTTQNLLTYSEDFTNAAWTKTGSTITANAATAPNGTLTADKLVEASTSVLPRVSRTFASTASTTYTLSVYVKSAEISSLRLRIQKKDGTYADADADLLNESFFNQSNGATGAILSVGNGWYRVSNTTNLGSGATANTEVSISFLGVPTILESKGISIWGAQLEPNELGPYQATVASAAASTLRLGWDRSQSGYGTNTWSAFSFSVAAGVDNDSLEDSPTNYGSDLGAGGELRGNYAVLNPLTGASSLVDGNLRPSSDGTRISTLGMVTGKWYCEMNVTTVGTISDIGVHRGTTFSTYVGSTSTGYSYSNNGQKYTNAAGSLYGATYTSGDVIGCAFDADAGTVVFYKNGVSQGTAFTGLTSGPYYFAIYGRSSATANNVYINFGQRPFANIAPTGHKCLCTTNLLKTTAITTSGSFTGNANADGPLVRLNGVPTAMTINGNAVTFATHADKLATGFKIRTALTTYNLSGSNTFSITTTGAKTKYAVAQVNTASAPPGTEPIPNPIAFWNFEQASNTDPVPATNTSSYPLTLITASTGTTGKLSNCISFANDTQGLFTNTQIWNRVASPTSFSVAFWWRPQAAPAFTILGNAFGTMGFVFDYLDAATYSPNHGVAFNILTGNGYNWARTYQKATPTINTWIYVVGTYDHLNLTGKLYINGTNTDTNTNATTLTNPPEPGWHGFALNGSVTPGGKEYGSNQAFDALGLWTIALTQNMVNYLYNSGTGRQWPF